MITAIITSAFSIIMAVVMFTLKVILYPVDVLIQAALPGISTALTSVGAFLDIAVQSLGWVISVSGIPSAAIALIGLYYVFKLTLPIQVWTIKLAVKWYQALKI